MQITNNHNLPESFVNFARNDKYSKGKSDISVTTLIDSPRVRLLREANSTELSVFTPMSMDGFYLVLLTIRKPMEKQSL